MPLLVFIDMKTRSYGRLLSSVDDSLQSCLIHTISGINGNLACEQLLFCILDGFLCILRYCRLINIVVSKAYNARPRIPRIWYSPYGSVPSTAFSTAL